jgi:hypothetical protein
VAGTPVPPFLSRDGQDIVHENPEQKYLNANKIIEIQKTKMLNSSFPPLLGLFPAQRHLLGVVGFI